MAFLDQYPVLKKALANQYQAILLGGAAAFSALTLSPFPLLLLAGAEMMVMPFLFERLKRRIEIEKKYAERRAQTLSLEEQLAALPRAAQERFSRLRDLCDRVQANYRGLSPASQGILAEQAGKFDALLASCLRRMWLFHKYEEMLAAFDPKGAARQVEQLRESLASPELAPRVRGALEKNLEIREELLRTVAKNAASREALRAELDSLEALLQLLLQKSVAATDATAFSVEIDDVLAQAEADAASVEEMERMLGAFPDMAAAPALPARAVEVPPPPPPPPPRMRGGRR